MKVGSRELDQHCSSHPSLWRTDNELGKNANLKQIRIILSLTAPN